MTFTTKTIDELITELKINLVNNVEGINDLNVGSTIDIIMTTLANSLEGLYTELNDVYNASRVSTAEGDDLENLGSIIGINRDDGTKSSGYVTMLSTGELSTNFTINQGSQVSSQPNTDTTQLIFNVTEDTPFYAIITNEENLFIDGTYDYKLSQRFIGTLSELKATVSLVSDVVLTEGIDYELIKYEDDYISKIIIDVENITEFNYCESTTNWTNSDDAGAPGLSVSIFKQGTSSIQLTKTATTGVYATYEFTHSSTVDSSNKSLIFDLYVHDSTTLNKLNQINVTYSNDSLYNNSYTRNVSSSDLEVGWNKIIIDPEYYETSESGNIDESNIKYLKIQVETLLSSDTFSSDTINIDNILFSNYEDYYGDIIRFTQGATLPDSSTNFKSTYNPISVEVPIEASNVGVNYNVVAGIINYKITPYSYIKNVYNYNSISGGVDAETDDELREKILNASSLNNVSTISAIEANVSNLNYVSTCIVNDLPEKEITNETHYYSSTSNKVSLIKSIPIDDANLIVSNVTTPKTYVKNTDYELIIDFTNNEYYIQFLGIDDPSNGDELSVNYHYNALGWFDVYVTGINGELNNTQIEEIEDLIKTIKSSGPSFTVTQPTYLPINVTLSISVDTGYTVSGLTTSIENNIDEYITNLDIGEDVLLSKIIQITLNVTGVSNVVISDIGGGGASDYVIDSDEKAINGTTTVNTI